MQLLLDTDVLIDLLRKRPQAIEWAHNLPARPFLSGVATLEASSASRSLAESREIAAVLSRSAVLWPTDEDIRRATVEFSTLRLAHGIGSLDAVCAAQALRLKLPLATFNVKHFRAVPRLTTVTPYIR